MSKNLFANSKAALVFAAVTIGGTLMMVGPRDGGGFLDAAVDRFGQKPADVSAETRAAPEERSESTAVELEPLDPAAGWGGTAAPVFGDYEDEEEQEEETTQTSRSEPTNSPSSPWRQESRSAPRRAPDPGMIGGPVKADGQGSLVPRESPQRDDPAPLPEPVVISRQLSIDPG